MEPSLYSDIKNGTTSNMLKDISIETYGFIAFFICLIYTSTHNFLAFHTGVELFSSAIGFGIFSMCINTYPISKNKFIMLLGIGYVFVAIADIFHALTFPGVNIFVQGTIQISLQFWIVSRYMEVSILLLSVILSFNKLKKFSINILFIAYSAVFGSCIVFILVYPIFPKCYIPGLGMTTFKVISEYIISIILIIIGVFYHIHRDKLTGNLYKYMELNIIFTLIGELIFSKYIFPYEPLNIVGHLLKVLSFYFIYKGVTEQGLNNPYSLLFSKFSEAKQTINVKNSEIKLINQELLAAKAYTKEMERFFLASEVCLDLLLHQSPVAIYAYSEGKFIFANNKACEVFGLEEPQYLVGKSVVEFIYPEEGNLTQHYIGEIYKEFGHVDSQETKILTAQRKVIDVSLLKTIFDYKGKPACLCILRDMSTIKQVEVLKKDVQENKKLLNESLELNKLIKEFFANLSHELRTPLNVMLGALQVLSLSKNNDSPEVRLSIYDKYCKTIKQNCYRLLRLINNLIDISKMDAGFSNLNLRNRNIVSLIEDITLSVVEYANNKGINLIFDTDVEEKITAVDADSIERVVLNLLSNAIKFTSPGDEILVNINDQDDNIIITVKDTGIGIPKEKLDIIFERFRQADNSLSRNGEGSGIGLSLVKSLIEMHDGTIDVMSTEGIGTEFIIRLPVKIVDTAYNDPGDMMSGSKVERINIEFSDIYS